MFLILSATTKDQIIQKKKKHRWGMGKSYGKGTILKQQNESWQLLALSLKIFLGLDQKEICRVQMGLNPLWY